MALNGMHNLVDTEKSIIFINTTKIQLPHKYYTITRRSNDHILATVYNRIEPCEIPTST